MGKPRPTFGEAWMIGWFRFSQGFAAVFAIVATIILIVNTAHLIGTQDYRTLLLIWLAAPVFYAAAAFFFFVGRTLARRMEKDFQSFGEW